MTGNIPVPKTK